MHDDKRDLDPEIAKIICEFQWLSLVELSRVFLRGVAFYFLIIGSILGFLIATNGTNTILLPMLKLALAITILAVIAGITFAYGANAGLQSLKRNYRLLDEKTFEILRVAQFINRARITMWVVGICSLLAMTLFTAVLIMLIQACSGAGCITPDVPGASASMF